MMKLKNATELFNQPTGKFHHSESRWSTIAQMAFIWLSKQEKSLKLFRSTIKDNRKHWMKESGKLHFTGWTASCTYVEPYIKRVFDGKSDVKTKLKPDIVWISEEKKHIILVEVKTVGSTPKHNLRQMEEYEQLIEKLSEEGWCAELYYLMSYGFEDRTDKFLEWHALQEKKIGFLLWEELFSAITEFELASYIHENLEDYTLMPDWIK